MRDKLAAYRRAAGPLPAANRLWPLYGAGFDNLGRGGRPIEASLPGFGPDELLVRHDACGLCFSDVKVIRLGDEHPRIHRDMRSDPVVLGHEVSLTVAGVGQTWRGRYHPGDRFIVQADIRVDGLGTAYGYEIQGGLSQYAVLDRRVLAGDDGCYLLPVRPSTGYAAAALAEPWACVMAAYELEYRTGLKAGGTTWIIGAAPSPGLTISAGFDEQSHPARVMLTGVPGELEAWLRGRAAALGVDVAAAPDVRYPPHAPVDDVIVLGADADVVETVSPFLADSGILAVIAREPMSRRVAVDVGRVHYHRWLYVGGPGPDIARAYGDVPVRSGLRPGGRAWFVGAGGPMGRMHVQRAIEEPDGPGTIACTDLSDARLAELRASCEAPARARGIEWLCLNPARPEECEDGLARLAGPGFDDIIVLAPSAQAIAGAAAYLARRGVMNVFAGVGRGTMAALDLGDVYLRDVRIIGHSGSSIDDLRLTLHRAETGRLSPNRSVAAVGSLEAARDGLRAVQDGALPGKIVIYPHIRPLPLTALPDLKDTLPGVYARLKDGREWAVEAEAELLRRMLL